MPMNLASGWTARLVSLSSKAKMGLVMAADAVISLTVACAALLLVNDTSLLSLSKEIFLGFLAAIMVVASLRFFESYRAVIRFVDYKLIARLIQGYLVAAIALFAIARYLDRTAWSGKMLVIFAILGPAVALQVRLLAQRLLRPYLRRDRGEPVLIYGAGHAGTQLAAALATSACYKVKGFVDDRPSLQGREVLGHPVYPPAKMQALKEEDVFSQIIVAMPSITKSSRRAILESLESLSVKVQVVPGLDEVASGQRKLEDVREVQVEDLLGRDPVAPIAGLIEAQVRGQSVLVTGAGGSIGSELCRQIAALGVSKLVLFEVSEYALYKLDQELQLLAQKNGFELIPVLGSVVDETAIDRAIRKHGINTLYHAAAYKHVPLVESNVCSAIRNNIFGTLYTCRSAIKNGVSNFILVSTDKAVRPTSVMGASKRVCELIVQVHASENPQTSMSMVRFGNVLASSGSVVPLFREQIRTGGPVTVTHHEVTRYFMTIPEAAQLVLQAGAMGKHGEVFVLDMGQPVKIIDLAERMIHLSGQSIRTAENVHGDIEIKVTGLRPGEKLYEELLIGNNPCGTSHPRIFLAKESSISKAQLVALMARLEKAINEDSIVVIRACLEEVVEDFFTNRVVGATERSDAELVLAPHLSRARLGFPAVETPRHSDSPLKTFHLPP